ncbi:hypothetical protein D3C83_163680 [compost metagenome]
MLRQIGMIGRQLEGHARMAGRDQIVIDVAVRGADVAFGAQLRSLDDVGHVAITKCRLLRRG